MQRVISLPESTINAVSPRVFALLPNNDTCIHMQLQASTAVDALTIASTGSDPICFDTEKILHALVGMGSVGLAVAVHSLTRVGRGLQFPLTDNEVL